MSTKQARLDKLDKAQLLIKQQQETIQRLQDALELIEHFATNVRTPELALEGVRSVLNQPFTQPCQQPTQEDTSGTQP